MAVNVLISWLNYCLNKLYFIILFLVNISGRVVSRLVYLLSAFFVARLRNGLETVPHNTEVISDHDTVNSFLYGYAACLIGYINSPKT